MITRSWSRQLFARKPRTNRAVPARLRPRLEALEDRTLLNSSGFDGMNFRDSVNGYVPPDTDIAVGPQYVIETVNSQIQFYDKATGTPQKPNTPLNQFFGQPNELPFDPVVTYDDIAGRFIVAAPTFSNDMLFAVSKDSNPLDGFHTYDLDVSEGGNLPDYTKIGWNADEVVITFNMYPVTSAFHVQILSFAASSIFSASPLSTLTLGVDYFSNDRTNNDFTMAAASMHGATSGMPMYFVQENGFDNGSQMDVVSASNLLSNSPSYTDTVVNVDSYTYPPSAQQPGGYIQTNDTRILNADWRDGLLVADQNIGLHTDNDAHARWYEFNVTGSPYLVQDGTITPGPGTSTYFPAIAIAPGDVIGMTYNESSPNEFPSIYDTGRTSRDPAGTMEAPVLSKAGTATYSDFAIRWGDFSGISVDPSDGSFWSGAEYSTSLLSGQPANWATYITNFGVTAAQQVTVMIQQVDYLVSTGVLNSGNGNALEAKLKLTGNTNADINRINAFVNQVEAFVHAGKLTPDQAAPLLNAATRLLLSLSLS